MTEALSETQHVAISPSAYARAFGADLVLLEFSRGEYFGLDAIGAEIWRQLETGSDLAACAKHLENTYDVSYETALNDTRTLIGSLVASGLVALV